MASQPSTKGSLRHKPGLWSTLSQKRRDWEVRHKQRIHDWALKHSFLTNLVLAWLVVGGGILVIFCGMFVLIDLTLGADLANVNPSATILTVVKNGLGFSLGLILICTAFKLSDLAGKPKDQQLSKGVARILREEALQNQLNELLAVETVPNILSKKGLTADLVIHSLFEREPRLEYFGRHYILLPDQNRLGYLLDESVARTSVHDLASLQGKPALVEALLHRANLLQRSGCSPLKLKEEKLLIDALIDQSLVEFDQIFIQSLFPKPPDQGLILAVMNAVIARKPKTGQKSTRQDALRFAVAIPDEAINNSTSLAPVFDQVLAMLCQPDWEDLKGFGDDLKLFLEKFSALEENYTGPLACRDRYVAGSEISKNFQGFCEAMAGASCEFAAWYLFLELPGLPEAQDGFFGSQVRKVHQLGKAGRLRPDKKEDLKSFMQHDWDKIWAGEETVPEGLPQAFTARMKAALKRHQAGQDTAGAVDSAA